MVRGVYVDQFEIGIAIDAFGHMLELFPVFRVGKERIMVEGEVFNIKITYPYDLRVAESILGGNGVC